MHNCQIQRLVIYFVQVNYSAAQWLMKNMDPLNENIVQYLQASQDPFVCHIWKDGEQKDTKDVKISLVWSALKNLQRSKNCR